MNKNKMWIRIGNEIFDIEHLECVRAQKNHIILYYNNEEKHNAIFYFYGENADIECQEVLTHLQHLLEAHQISLSEYVELEPNIYQTFYKWDYKSELNCEIERVKRELYKKYKEKYEKRLKKLKKEK